jgi:hypothetical protein
LGASDSLIHLRRIRERGAEAYYIVPRSLL